MASKKPTTVFITVGTTLFQDLVDEVTSEAALASLAQLGCTKLIIQYGKGAAPASTYPGIGIKAYNFKPSLQQDMQACDLLVCHAGAGTVMEACKLGAKVAVVINSKLMDNHQCELAHAMGTRGYLHVVESPELLRQLSTWDDILAFNPVPYEAGDLHEFPRILDNFMGVRAKAD